MDPVTIVGWQRISPEVTTSGLLRERDLTRLAELGVRSVIDLALADHANALADEGAKLASLGLSYANIPVPFDAPAEPLYQQFREAFEQAARPVHVHCIANWRVSAFLYRYHLEHGMDEGEARRLMRQQWLPDASDHPDAKPWADFVQQARNANDSGSPQPAQPTGGGHTT